MPHAAVHRLLVVEDDAATLQGLRAALAATPGTQVSGCSTVAEARSAIDRLQPQIVLTDLGLPDGSGIEVIRHAVARGAACEVLVISIFGDDAHVVAAIEAGASGYLLKDSSLEQLADQLQHLRDGGSPLSPQIARTLIRRQRLQTAAAASPPVPLPTPGERIELTERELEVLTFIAKGFSYQEGAQMLGVSANTVRTHVKRIYQKLAVNSRTQAVYEFNQQQLAQGLPPLW